MICRLSRYDPNDIRLIEKTDAMGQKTVYKYDGQGRMVTNLFYNSAQTLVKTVAYGYDNQGRMINWSVSDTSAFCLLTSAVLTTRS